MRLLAHYFPQPCPLMKHLFTSIFLASYIFCFAQPSFFQTQFQWDEPDFDQEFLLRNKVKSIKVQTYTNPDAPKGTVASGAVYEYDSDGNLIQMVETQYDDTSRIHDFLYSDRGVLRWQKVVDKVWNKTYRSGYRFTRNKTVFQVKSYEMLNNDEKMLLDTRQYVYDDDSLLIEIRCRENDRLMRVHKFTYDEKQRMTKEQFENGAGDTLKQVLYVYGKDDNILRITIEDTQKHDYIYTYNEAGDPTAVTWKQNNIDKGIVTYAYDNKTGMLTEMQRKVFATPTQSQGVLQVFSYEVHTESVANTD